MTIREIAASLGVSPSTVSVVLNKRPGVSSELRAQIEEELIANGYVIKDSKEANGTFRFIYYKSTNYLAARKDGTLELTLEGLEQVCKEKNYSFSLVNANHKNLHTFFEPSSLSNIDGIILLGTEYYHHPLEEFLYSPVPFVILDGYFPEFPINAVNIDNSYGIHKALRYLVECGHDHIGYIRSSIEFGCLRDRKNCVYTSSEIMNLSLDKNFILEVSQEAPEIQKQVESFLKNKANLPTAFIADNDIIGIASIQAFQKLGYSVPDDISIIGFDDSNICTIFSPNLTTIKADFKRMAREATYRLINMIEKKEKDIIKSTVGTEFILRNTVAILR